MISLYPISRRPTASRLLRAFVLLACLLPLLVPAATLDEDDLATLTGYLDTLDAGGGANPALVDGLSEADFACLRLTMQRYVALDADAGEATERAYLVLLDRFSRQSLLPWPMLQLYSPDFSEFLVGTRDGELAEALYARLSRSTMPRAPWELAVRLTPGPSLRHLRDTPPTERYEEWAAWARRLRRSPESRPIPDRDALATAICEHPLATTDARLLEQQLAVAAAWPHTTAAYERGLRAALTSTDAEIVRAGLRAQADHPRLLALNEAIATRFAAQPVVARVAIENLGFEPADIGQAAILRRIWLSLEPEQVQQRYACIFAMSVHPGDNAALVIDAVRERPEEYLDVAVDLLATGDPAAVRALVHDVLSESRAHEPALRLARQMRLPDLADDALRTLATSKDLIVQLAAIHYLATTPGNARRALLPYLKSPDHDLRLAVIMALSEPTGLIAYDREIIGPALVRIALSDPLQGHRQEALFGVARWKDQAARELFVKLRRDHAAASGLTADLHSDEFWSHRTWLVATLGLALLGDAPARADLHALLAVSDPAIRLEAVMIFLAADEVPDAAFAELTGTEPKLVANTAHLIAAAGDATARARLRDYVQQRPLFALYAIGGIDDHDILHMADAHFHADGSHAPHTHPNGPNAPAPPVQPAPQEAPAP